MENALIIDECLDLKTETKKEKPMQFKHNSTLITGSQSLGCSKFKLKLTFQ